MQNVNTSATSCKPQILTNGHRLPSVLAAGTMERFGGRAGATIRKIHKQLGARQQLAGLFPTWLQTEQQEFPITRPQMAHFFPGRSCDTSAGDGHRLTIAHQLINKTSITATGV